MHYAKSGVVKNDVEQQAAMEFLTIPEVAGILRVSRLTVYRLVERREIPTYRFARRIRILKADILAYIGRQRRDISDFHSGR